MASSSTGFWAAYNAVTTCCTAKGSRGPYHRHCGCALHFLPHEIHSTSANECVSMPKNGHFKSLSIHSTIAGEKKLNGQCGGSPLVLQSFENCPFSVGQISSSTGENALSIGLIQDMEEEENEYSDVATRSLTV